MHKGRFTEEEGQELARGWKGSGMTMCAFARRVGVGEWRVRYWCRRAEGAAGIAALVPVAVSRSHVRGVEVRVGAARIEVCAGFDAELLRQVVVALGEGRC